MNMVDLSIVMLVYQRVERGVRNLAAGDSYLIHPLTGIRTRRLFPMTIPGPYGETKPCFARDICIDPIYNIILYTYNCIYPVYPCFFFSICPSQMPKKEINESSMQEICAVHCSSHLNMLQENPSTSIHRDYSPSFSEEWKQLKKSSL